MTAPTVDLVGAQEIAGRLDVSIHTVHQWRTRKLLPAPDWRLGAGDIWQWTTIEAWARETGRLTPPGSQAPRPANRR